MRHYDSRLFVPAVRRDRPEHCVVRAPLRRQGAGHPIALLANLGQVVERRV